MTYQCMDYARFKKLLIFTVVLTIVVNAIYLIYSESHFKTANAPTKIPPTLTTTTTTTTTTTETTETPNSEQVQLPEDTTEESGTNGKQISTIKAETTAENGESLAKTNTTAPIAKEAINDALSKTKSKETIVAAMSSDDTDWISEKNMPGWKHNIYFSDDPNARTRFMLPVNKGHESMVYLTYIIENYDKLPQFMVFMHGEQYQWHNDDPIWDGARVVRSLQLPNLLAKGYVNLRCTWVIGCPDELHPKTPRVGFVRDPDDKHIDTPREATERIWAQSFLELFPEEVTVPENVSVSCCSQFAVTKDKVHQRPKSDYVRFRQWLIDTPLTDLLSGRVFEYTWHIIWGMPAHHCPNVKMCYCETFGLCDLKCTDKKCEGRYRIPMRLPIPKSWPNLLPGEKPV